MKPGDPRLLEQALRRLFLRSRHYLFTTLYRPGEYLQGDQLVSLTAQLRRVASSCFREVPDYQVLAGTRADYQDKVLSLAKRKSGEIVGFSSAVILDVPEVGEVLHLGLTCVEPGHRGHRLCHRLNNMNFASHLIRNGVRSSFWISNISSQVSGLAPPGQFFDEVFPSHRSALVAPPPIHRIIARAVSERYRAKVHIRADAEFDPATFVFRRGNVGGPFHHDETDPYRDLAAAGYYLRRMSPGLGDAMLQVGRGSLLGVVRHLWRR